MPLLAPLADQQAGPDAKKLFDALTASIRMVPNIFRTMGHAPAVLEHTLGLDAAIQHDLDPKLRELAYLTAAHLNKCGYCEHYHNLFARKAGLSEPQIKQAGLSVEGVAYTEVEKLVIRFAQEWTQVGKVSAEVVEALNKHLTPSQMIVLSATLALANFTTRFNETFGVQLP